MRKTYAGIDDFRLAAAFMVTAIHIGPFSGWSEDLDYLITCCAGRVAVPFFLMTTGYFVLAPYGKSGFQRKKTLHRYLTKNVTLYLAATLFYAPLALYAGNVPHSMAGFFRAVLFDGTFYHLWYFPAAVIGCLLLVFLMKRSMRAAVVFSVGAYIAGLLGDSYYGVTKQIPLLAQIYSRIFSVSSYTRNGIFFAPVFLMLGVMSAFWDEKDPRNRGGQPSCKKRLPDVTRKRNGSRCRVGLLVCFAGMLAEGYLTYSLNLQRHNSMYLLLPFVMYFLFQLLLAIPEKASGSDVRACGCEKRVRSLFPPSSKDPGWIRNASMLLYLLHPAVIVCLRGFARIAGLTELLIENTFVQYLSVCALSSALLFMIHKVARVLTDGRLRTCL